MPRDVILGCAPITLEKRAEIQEAVSYCTAALCRENGGAQRVGELLGITTTRTYDYGNRNNPAQISFWRIAALTSSKATSAARYLATLAGGVFVPLTVRDGDILKLTAAAARDNGRAIAETVEALAGKTVTRREAAAAVRDIDAAIADLASLRASVTALPEAAK